MTELNVTLDPQSIVAWDFDGVLNRNIVNGRFVWADRFEVDIGHSLADFTQAIFRSNFDDIITGKEDLRDRLIEWARNVGFIDGADRLLLYWFKNDALPDPKVGEIVDALNRRGIRQVIVTNNEARRASYIEREMGFAKRVERVFASGRIGLRKPDFAFYAHVTDKLGAHPSQMLLIDDCPKNVPASIRCGWRAFHFTDKTRDALPKALGLSQVC